MLGWIKVTGKLDWWLLTSSANVTDKEKLLPETVKNERNSVLKCHKLARVFRDFVLDVLTFSYERERVIYSLVYFFASISWSKKKEESQEQSQERLTQVYQSSLAFRSFTEVQWIILHSQYSITNKHLRWYLINYQAFKRCLGYNMKQRCTSVSAQTMIHITKWYTHRNCKWRLLF